MDRTQPVAGGEGADDEYSAMLRSIAAEEQAELVQRSSALRLRAQRVREEARRTRAIVRLSTTSTRSRTEGGV
jgi:hypothetical protein